MSSSKITHVARIWYINDSYSEGYPHLENGMELLTMYKHNNEEAADPFIHYLGYSYNPNSFKEELFENISLDLTDKKFNNVSVFKHYRKQWWNSTESEIQTLYWDNSNGIIRYDTFDGKKWERINW